MQTGILIQYSDDDFRNLLKEVIREVIGETPEQIDQKVQKPLTLQEACEYVHLSESHMYKLTSTNQIPHSKPGKRIYFDTSELDQ